MTVSPQVHRQKSWAGRIGASVLRARHDPIEYTAAGRESFLRRFWPNDPALSKEEAEKRARAALRAHMIRLALASAKARAARMAARRERAGKWIRK